METVHMPLVEDGTVCAALHPDVILAESVPHLTWISGPHGDVQYANRKAREYVGQSLDEVTGWRWENCVHPDDLDRVTSNWINVVRSGTELQQEVRIRRHDGVYRWHIACAQPSFDIDGNISRWVGTCTDIEDRKQAEEAVHQSEQRFRSIIEKSLDAVILFRADGAVSYASPASARLLGYDSDELPGQNSYEFVHPDDAEQVRAVYRELGSAPGHSVTSIYRLRDQDGAWRWIEARGTNLLNQPSVQAIVVTYRDVTREHRAEEALRESEERLRRVLDSLPAAAYTCDPDGLITYFNAQAVEAWGRTPRLNDPSERWCGAHQLSSAEGKPIPHDQCWLARAVAENRAYHGRENVLVRSNGERRFILEHANPLLDANGRVAGGINVQVDITDRKRAEAEILEWRNRYEAAIQATGQVLYVWDTATSTVQWGGNTHEVLGCRPGDLPVTLPGWLDLIHPDDLAAFNRACEQTTATRDPVRIEYRVRRKDGRFIHIDDRGRFLSADGQTTRIVGFLSDVTATRQIEEQYRQAQKMEAIGKLAGGIAHDFNNLLTIINGYSEIVLGMLDSREESHSLVEEVKKAGERAAGLTRQLLAFSRRQMLHQRTLNLSGVVSDLGKMLHRVLGEDIELVLKPGRNLMKVQADPGQIEQVIMNLAVNARDAMPTGGTLIIETANVELSPGRGEAGAEIRPGRYVALTVSDTGCGIPEEIREHIYEPFFTTKKPGQGTGLGLATVYGIIKQSEGHVSFESQVGRGTTFRVYLPAVGAASSFIDKVAAPNDLPGGDETILLVEDEVSVRAMTRLLLQRLGYDVLVAGNAEQAIAAFQNSSKPVELLLTDVVMPGLSGRVIAEELQALDPRLRVLFMSGYTDDAVVRHGVEQDEVHFLAKPYTVTALAKTVRAALDMSAV